MVVLVAVLFLALEGYILVVLGQAVGLGGFGFCNSRGVFL